MRIKDEELNAKIKDIKLFEHLHNERPSPLYLNLIRCSNQSPLNSIISDDGVPFLTDCEREAHIVTSFEKTYTGRQSCNINYDTCIQEFLGPDICNHPLVQNSKLNVDEKTRLDAPLSLQELDDSMDKCNLKSAAGNDGFSNKLRYLLFNYANHCFNTGILTHNFRSANIKLIPKKGDARYIKNWRPISLLSNMYKIISRAINIRLNTVVNRICSRAQKGYNSYRYTQEVLINVVETISYCKDTGIRGAVLAVDMAKAFDTLDHNFINSVYKFFGLGENIIRWLNVLGNSREACIILDNNRNSRYFKLGSGRPQGDNLSPNMFNFCEQILIFKIELGKNISRIPRDIRIRVEQQDDFFSTESNRETVNNESLADDNTVLFTLDNNSLICIKQVLADFADISGLECNYDKTALLPIHQLTLEEQGWINNAGFNTVNKIKLLGADITADLTDLNNNFIVVQEKILKQISFWSRFRLTLPGRISIAKTFMISLLNYLGCVLQPDDNTLNNI
jgi:hypothetical protein